MYGDSCDEALSPHAASAPQGAPAAFAEGLLSDYDDGDESLTEAGSSSSEGGSGGDGGARKQQRSMLTRNSSLAPLAALEGKRVFAFGVSGWCVPLALRLHADAAQSPAFPDSIRGAMLRGAAGML